MNKKNKNKEQVIETLLDDITEETLAELSDNKGGEE